MNSFLNDLLLSHQVNNRNKADDSKALPEVQNIVIHLVDDNARRHSCPPDFFIKPATAQALEAMMEDDDDDDGDYQEIENRNVEQIHMTLSSSSSRSSEEESASPSDSESLSSTPTDLATPPSLSIPSPSLPAPRKSIVPLNRTKSLSFPISVKTKLSRNQRNRGITDKGLHNSWTTTTSTVSNITRKGMLASMAQEVFVSEASLNALMLSTCCTDGVTPEGDEEFHYDEPSDCLEATQQLLDAALRVSTQLPGSRTSRAA